jgi:hypothetical protein
MIEIYTAEGQKLSSWKNLHEYARAEQSERIHSKSKLSHRINTIYVAAYYCIQYPGRHTYSTLYSQNIYVKQISKPIPKTDKTI